MILFRLTLRLLLTTIEPYTNSLDPDETPSNSASHRDRSCLTLRQYFHKLRMTLKYLEICSRLVWQVGPMVRLLDSGSGGSSRGGSTPGLGTKIIYGML